MIGALAELLLDLRQRHLQGFGFFAAGGAGGFDAVHP